MTYVFIAAIILIMILIITNIRIVPQSDAYVIERLGAYHATWNVGLHVKLPLLDRIAKRFRSRKRFLTFRRSL